MQCGRRASVAAGRGKEKSTEDGWCSDDDDAESTAVAAGMNGRFRSPAG